jgi:hypothetical protein
MFLSAVEPKPNELQHVFERSNFHGDHLLAGIVMLGVAVIVWCVPFERHQGVEDSKNWPPASSSATTTAGRWPMAISEDEPRGD